MGDDVLPHVDVLVKCRTSCTIMPLQGIHEVGEVTGQSGQVSEVIPHKRGPNPCQILQIGHQRSALPTQSAEAVLQYHSVCKDACECARMAAPPGLPGLHQER